MNSNFVAFLVVVVSLVALYRFNKRFRLTIKALGNVLILDLLNDPPPIPPHKYEGKIEPVTLNPPLAPPVAPPKPAGQWLSRYGKKVFLPLTFAAVLILLPCWWWQRHSEAWKLALSDHISEAWVLLKQGPQEPVYYASSGETLHLLTRMFDIYADELGHDVHRTGDAWVVDHYWQYWTTDTFNDYSRANRRFVDSGGKIHRMFILSDEELRDPRIKMVLRNQCEKIGAEIWRADPAIIKGRPEYQVVAHAFQQLPHTGIGFQTFDVLQLEDLLYYSSDFSNDYRVLGGSTWFYGHELDLKPLFNRSIAQPIDCSAWKAPQLNDAL